MCCLVLILVWLVVVSGGVLASCITGVGGVSGVFTIVVSFVGDGGAVCGVDDIGGGLFFFLIQASSPEVGFLLWLPGGITWVLDERASSRAAASVIEIKG